MAVGATMAFWKFFDYITEQNRNPIQDWYGTVGSEVQAAFDVLVQELAGTEDWDAPKPKKRKCRLLKDKHAGMYELIFKVGKQKFRPLGIMYQDRREFVLLGGCEHRRWQNIPPGAFDDAFKLKEFLEQGRGTTREHV